MIATEPPTIAILIRSLVLAFGGRTLVLPTELAIGCHLLQTVPAGPTTMHRAERVPATAVITKRKHIPASTVSGYRVMLPELGTTVYRALVLDTVLRNGGKRPAFCGTSRKNASVAFAELPIANYAVNTCPLGPVTVFDAMVVAMLKRLITIHHPLLIAARRRTRLMPITISIPLLALPTTASGNALVVMTELRVGYPKHFEPTILPLALVINTIVPAVYNNPSSTRCPTASMV